MTTYREQLEFILIILNERNHSNNIFTLEFAPFFFESKNGVISGYGSAEVLMGGKRMVRLRRDFESDYLDRQTLEGNVIEDLCKNIIYCTCINGFIYNSTNFKTEFTKEEIEGIFGVGASSKSLSKEEREDYQNLRVKIKNRVFEILSSLKNKVTC